MQQVDPALTIVPVDHIRKPEDDEEEEEESSEEEEEVDLPPGPISSEHCTVGGPGFVGGSAKSSISFYVTAKDETGKRIRDGGAYVTATVNPGRVARAGGAELVFADIRDNSDGTYTATYTVEARGDYELSVEVNGSPIGGSPFPVFFSPPEPAASNEPPASAAATGTPQSPAYPVASFMPGGTAAVPSVTAPDGTVLNTANAALSLQPPSVLGPQAHKAGVTFPKDQAALDRTLLVGNLNPSVTDEQIRQLFGFCGAVIGLNRVGDQQQYMLIEYTYPTEAAAASAMHGMQVVDRKIAVEQAAVAERAKEPGDANPYAQIQAHQLQHVMAAQIQQSSLAAQVAAMRVQAKTNPASATAPGLAQNSASQKNAALAAIAALSRRLGGSTDAQLPRPESPTKVKKRREVSPTIRKRDSRQSRSPSARRRFDRRLSPPIKRRDSVERRPYKRDSSRDRRRGRSGSRERARPKHAERRRSPSRERPARRDARDEPSRRRDRDRSRERTADRRQQGDRVSSRHRDDDSLRRHRDNRDRDNKYGSERPRERDEGGRRDRDTERRSNKDEDRRRSGQEDRRKSEARDNGHASPSNGKASMPRDASSSPKVNGCLSEEASRPADEAQKSPVPDVDKGAQKDEQQQKQAEEAQQLRERALEALSAAAAKPPATEGDGASDDLSRKPESLEGIEGHKRGRSMSHSPEQEERKRKKEKKDKKHKKHKRHQ